MLLTVALSGTVGCQETGETTNAADLDREVQEVIEEMTRLYLGKDDEAQTKRMEKQFERLELLQKAGHPVVSRFLVCGRRAMASGRSNLKDEDTLVVLDRAVVLRLYYDGPRDDFVKSKLRSQDLLEDLASLTDPERKELKEDIGEILDMVSYSGKAEPDFTVFEGIIRKCADAPPVGLVDYMLEKSRKVAAVTLIKSLEEEPRQRKAQIQRIEEMDAKIGKARFIFDLKKRADGFRRLRSDLEELAEHEAWWMRLYVVGVMRLHDDLRESAVIEKLGKDEHKLVREFAEAVAKGDPGDK